MEAKLPDKLTFRRREVIQLTRLDGRVLDYWEREFGGYSATEDNAGEKLYSRRDVEVILKIKQLLVVERLDKSRIKELIANDPNLIRSGNNNGGESKLGTKHKDLIKTRLREILTILDKHDKK